MSLDYRDESIKGQNNSYTKYIVFAFARSGSTFLHGSLSNHPNVIQYSEIFNNRNKIAFGKVYGEKHNNLPQDLIHFRNEKPQLFLDNYVFTTYNNHIDAVGIKIFPEHLESQEFKSIWTWIENNPDVKIINLVRINYLRSYLSRAIARNDKVYNITDGKNRSTTTIHIDLNDFKDYLKKREAYQLRIESLSKSHGYLNLPYEELNNQSSNCFKKIFGFLNIKDTKEFQASQLIKKETRRLQEVIENYDEIYNALKDTKWDYLFNENYQ